MPGTVIFLGAGATKACNGLLTNEILPKMLYGQAPGTLPDPTGRLLLLRNFVETLFHVSATTDKDSYPGLPLVMSLIDTALDRHQPLHPQWDAASLSNLREAIELGIYDVLEQTLLSAPTNNHWQLLQRVYPAPAEPCVISTNYDLVVDTAMMAVSSVPPRGPEGGFPNYYCAIATDIYRQETNRFGTLLKLHGSLSWLHCKTCNRLELGVPDSRKYLAVLNRLHGPSVAQAFTPDGSPCPACKTKLRPLLIAPSHLKDYRNPHLAQVWYEAERVLRGAERVIFIGYSLPEDDVEVVYLLKRSLSHLAPSRITVVEFDKTNPPVEANAVGRRYRMLFGDGVDWHPEGLDAWWPKSVPLAAAPAQPAGTAPSQALNRMTAPRHHRAVRRPLKGRHRRADG